MIKMWISSHIFSTKTKIKSLSVTLEHIIIEWIVKWGVYKILDKALQVARKKVNEGELWREFHFHGFTFLLIVQTYFDTFTLIKIGIHTLPLKNLKSKLVLLGLYPVFKTIILAFRAFPLYGFSEKYGDFFSRVSAIMNKTIWSHLYY